MRIFSWLSAEVSTTPPRVEMSAHTKLQLLKLFTAIGIEVATFMDNGWNQATLQQTGEQFTLWTNRLLLLQSLSSLLAPHFSDQQLYHTTRQTVAALPVETLSLGAVMQFIKKVSPDSPESSINPLLVFIQHAPSFVLSWIEAHGSGQRPSTFFASADGRATIYRLLFSATYLLIDGLKDQPGYDGLNIFRQDGELDPSQLAIVLTGFTAFTVFTRPVAKGSYQLLEYAGSSLASCCGKLSGVFGAGGGSLKQELLVGVGDDNAPDPEPEPKHRNQGPPASP